MPFLPRMKFQIESRRTPEEVRALLQSVTDSGRKWGICPDGWMAVPMAGFILFGQVLSRCGFYYSAGKARRKLEELLGDS
ncbi:MAG: hypothetical protein K2O15_14130 [Lachnospiraceae bacterium]|nr:hypothetical protein [Lachnospiraceae bacterium]